ncbi:MAG: hypothetical protein ACLFTK_16665 [Anaerolineales bacterium]
MSLSPNSQDQNNLREFPIKLNGKTQVGVLHLPAVPPGILLVLHEGIVPPLARAVVDRLGLAHLPLESSGAVPASASEEVIIAIDWLRQRANTRTRPLIVYIRGSAMATQAALKMAQARANDIVGLILHHPNMDEDQAAFSDVNVPILIITPQADTLTEQIPAEARVDVLTDNGAEDISATLADWMRPYLESPQIQEPDDTP